MLKTLRQIGFLLVFCAVTGACTALSAQSLAITAEILPGAPGRLLIRGSGAAAQSWSFRDSYAGIVGLGNRVRGFQVFDANGKQIATRAVAAGQFASSEPATSFKYEIELTPTSRPSEAAFVSWLGPERGVLMFGDLLPASPSARPNQATAIKARLVLPSDWTAYAGDTAAQQTEIEAADPDRAVVVIGKKIRVSTRAILGKPFTILTGGDWAFSDDDASEKVRNVLQFHNNNVGPLPCARASLVLLPFPQATSVNKWSAQTRGCTVTLLMGRVPSKVGALSQLELALTHELFHFWVPNGIGLSGDYDWFYEGFTMYEAARAAVQLDLISFDQFLNAIADAHDGSSGPGTANLSLIEASKQRWTIGSSSVYSKAMVVAFLYDLNLRFQSKGKRSLDNVYRNILQRPIVNSAPVSPAEVDGNALALSALRMELLDQDFVNRLVIARAQIDLAKELAPFGLHVEKPSVRTHISASAQLTSRQRDLLKQLSYNEPRRR